MKRKVPGQFITVSAVMHILNDANPKGAPMWDYDKTFRWLDKSKALIRRANKWVTTRDILKVVWREVYDEIMCESYDANEDDFSDV